MKKKPMAEQMEPQMDAENMAETAIEEKCPMCGAPMKANKAPKSIAEMKAMHAAISAKRPMRK